MATNSTERREKISTWIERVALALIEREARAQRSTPTKVARDLLECRAAQVRRGGAATGARGVSTLDSVLALVEILGDEARVNQHLADLKRVDDAGRSAGQASWCPVVGQPSMARTFEPRGAFLVSGSGGTNGPSPLCVMKN